MRATKSVLLIATLALAAFSFLLTPNIAAAETTDAWSTQSAIRASHFEEPLVVTAPTSLEEDRALFQALGRYDRRTTPEDSSALLEFVSDHPHSGWAAAVLTNLGLSDLHYGYFSRALAAFQAAWTAGKTATDPHAKALVDRAVGELARLEASLGRNDDLTALFKEIGHRPITGSATEAVQAASEELNLAAKDPRHLFLCGPLALQSLLLSEGANPAKVDFLEWYRASPNGTNLAEIGGLADKAQFAHRIVFRGPGQDVPFPSVVQWKVGHFAAIIGKANGRFHVQDSVFADRDVWISEAALNSEASGYYLVGSAVPAKGGWRSVDVAEASNVWGKGPSNNTTPGAAGLTMDQLANASDNNGPCPLCGYNISESTVSLDLSDTPVGYAPPIGPSAKVQITYSQREDSQPAVFGFFNVSPKWTLNWLSYVTDDPTNLGASVSRYLPGGGAYYYTGYQSTRGVFTAQTNDGSILALASQTPVTYRRQLSDGSTEIYAQSDGSTSYPRRIFLSQVLDPQGNALTLNYDAQLRLTSLTDATGRQTTFTYGLSSQPLLVTKITDPFGRSAKLTYDSSARLASITDIIGLTSSFAYDANSLVDALTTPYGTTNFSYTAPGTGAPPRFVQVTDPLGYHEREEWLEPAPIPDSDPTATLPSGMPNGITNQYLTYRDSFHWDKTAYALAGCTPTGGCDYSLARDRHFLHDRTGSIKSTVVESVKYPLENRVWFNYPGQTDAIRTGTYNEPIATGRVLDDGSTQLSLESYDTGGLFKPTQTVDPVGRVTSYSYSSHIDLAAISQTNAFGVQQTIAQFIYNTRHRPVFFTDAAGQTTIYAYNAAGQLVSATNPLGQKTTYQYNTAGDLTAVINANNATAASFTYDGADRIRTYTDSEGWIATYDYDAANRVTQITYPDGTKDLYAYDKLDLASFQDRQNRHWTYAHDANRRLTATTDPVGKQTLFGYNAEGELTALTDPVGNVTNWAYDVEGRLTQKTFADTTTVTNTYESTTSRLKSVLDALGQTRQYGYAKDNRLTGVSYLGAVNPTSNVGFGYDPYFPRLTSMTDGTGTTQYSYVPVGALGALQLQQENGPLSSSTIASTYDELGRLASRTVSGAGAETYVYDTIGRTIGHDSDLGHFTLSYLGQTAQPAQRQLASSTLSTAWNYLPNSGDRRLAEISNVGLSSSQHSTYQYTSTPEKFITAVAETSDAAPAYPIVSSQTATYNDVNQLTNLSGQALSYDADGNLLSDGQRNYSWDAENRLVGITYPGSSGKQTTFVYDALSRRTAIASTPTGGGSSVATSYLWCGPAICQARNASNSPTREYYAEGELVPGSSPQPYYYGPDQIGSTRRVFVSTSSAPAYQYDPYGNALQMTALVTDFGYAGMFFNADSGLDLTQFRAYDPVAGRWLSRDPLGETTSPSGNLYPYVSGNPISLVDPKGLLTFQLGLTLSGKLGWFGGSLGFGLAVDANGGFGGYGVAAWLPSAGGAASVGVSGAISNACTIDDLSGPFINGTGEGGSGPDIAGDVFSGPSSHGWVTGGGITLGAGVGGAVSYGPSYTGILHLFR